MSPALLKSLISSGRAKAVHDHSGHHVRGWGLVPESLEGRGFGDVGLFINQLHRP